MAEAKKKEVATVEEKSTAVAAFDYGDDAGAGYENTTSSDISIPFLAVLQSNSPQVQDVADGGIEGAKPGMLFNTVTEELFEGREKGVSFVPGYMDHVFVEWRKRDQGGGMVGMHAIDSKIVEDAKKAAKSFGKYETPDGNDLVETYYVYGLLNDEQLCVLAFTSTKISVFKGWNTKLNMFTVKTPDGRKIRPPFFAHQVKITTQKQKNSKGEFFNLVLAPANKTIADSLLPPGDERLEAAKGIGDMVKQGIARAAFDSQDKVGSEPSGSSSDAGPAVDKDSDIPF